MIDDIQDEFTATPVEKPKSHSALKSVFTVLVVWLVFVIISATVNIRGLVRELGSHTPSQMMETARDVATSSVTRKYTLFFVRPDGKTVSSFSSEVKVSGATEYQEALEGLLQGPSDEVLAQGAVTFIPSGTKLLGITLREGHATVNLNEGFLNTQWTDPDFKIASQQILKTLSIVDPLISEVTILINGKSLTEY